MTFIGKLCYIFFGQNSGIQAIGPYGRKGLVRSEDILRLKRILRKDTADQLCYEMLPANCGHFDMISLGKYEPLFDPLNP